MPKLREFLFSFFIIPLGGVESLLSRNSNVKAIDNLYKSVEDLIHDDYFKRPGAKNSLLKPNVPHGYIFNYYVSPSLKIGCLRHIEILANGGILQQNSPTGKGLS